MHTSTSLKKLMNIYFAVFGVSTENDNILVTHLSSSFDVICVNKNYSTSKFKHFWFF